MSIITRTHCYVVPMVPEKTKYNTYKRVRGARIRVEDVTIQPFNGGTSGNLESLTETEVNDQFVIRGPGKWPGGLHSIITFGDDPEEYDQIGKAKQHGIGTFTKHFQVRVKARGAEVK